MGVSNLRQFKAVCFEKVPVKWWWDRDSNPLHFDCRRCIHDTLWHNEEMV